MQRGLFLQQYWHVSIDRSNCVYQWYILSSRVNYWEYSMRGWQLLRDTRLADSVHRWILLSFQLYCTNSVRQWHLLPYRLEQQHALCAGLLLPWRVFNRHPETMQDWLLLPGSVDK